MVKVSTTHDGDNDTLKIAAGDSDTVVFFKGTDQEIKCIGYRRSLWKQLTFCSLVIFSFGFIYLITHWKPVWRICLTKKKCILCKADTVILKDLNSCTFVEEIVIRDVSGNLHHERSKAYTYSERDACDEHSTLIQRSKVLVKYFDHKHVRFVWKEKDNAFEKLSGLDSGVRCEEIYTNFNGLSEQERRIKLLVFGLNHILVEVHSYFKLLLEEVLNPFYIFQIFSVTLWFTDNYYIYASCIIVISALSIAVELYETRKQRQTLRDMVACGEMKINIILANGEIGEIDSADLVPGDVIVIPPRGLVMTCDAVLITGNVIVNEGMLTGESVPVSKTPLCESEADELYSPELHKRNTLFCGTHVIQTRYYGDSKVKAVVVRTGFSTAKGELVRSILFPKDLVFKFQIDSLKFIFFLAAMAVAGMTYIFIQLFIHKFSLKVAIINALDVTTVAIPPSLPAAMTVGIIFAQARLKKSGIFCISPQRINLGGKIQCYCFDKTGTLTEEGLDFSAVIPVEGRNFLPAAHEPKNLSPYSKIVVGMATCHSLTIIDKEVNGDPLDMIMFNSINWVLEETGQETENFDLLMPTVVKPVMCDSSKTDEFTEDMMSIPYEIGIIRQFTFSSGLQRMSVVVRVLGADQMDVYAKGAPEKIAALCKQNTIPNDFHEVLRNYAAQGLRVIAIASKSLSKKIAWHQVQRLSRDFFESELEFIGLVVMENKLKPETTPVIQQLKLANIRTVMVTGDNILTAITVARQCSMIEKKERLVIVDAQPPEDDKPASIQWQEEATQMQDDSLNPPLCIENEFSDLLLSPSTLINDMDAKFCLAVTGRSFGVIHEYFPELIPKIALHGTVFARMTPDQKSRLIENLQELGLYVGMCGDGANDCGALRTAHIGISLSEAEASVASPFTSKITNISCVPTVIREGRAALSTSFASFKFMTLYSIIQFTAVVLLISNFCKLSDFMFLYGDLLIIAVLALLMGRTVAYDHLDVKRPTSNILSPSNISSFIVQVFMVIGFQIGVFFYTRLQPWYNIPVSNDDGEPNSESMDSSSIFIISSFQYLILAFVLSKGPPYRKDIWTNVLFLSWWLVMVGLTVLMVVYPPTFLQKLLSLHLFPSLAFRLTLLGISAINFLVALIFENFVINSRLFKNCTRKLFCMPKKDKPYKRLWNESKLDPSWPPIGEVTLAADKDPIWVTEVS